MTFEYKVVPAPTRGRKAKGVKTPADRFARALEDTINELAAEGWEYQRTDTLPAEERAGLTSKVTVYHNLLVFRRPVNASAEAGKLPVLELGASAAAAPKDKEVRAEDPAASDARSIRQIRTESPQGAAPKLGSAFGGAARA